MRLRRHAWINRINGASRVTTLAAADMIASVGVIAHPLDQAVRDFYSRWGFQDLPFDPRRAMIVRMADLRQSFSDKSWRFPIKMSRRRHGDEAIRTEKGLWRRHGLLRRYASRNDGSNRAAPPLTASLPAPSAR